jgi:NTP pyrophosphatase (non-canonical NTP hydrolase)
VDAGVTRLDCVIHREALQRTQIREQVDSIKARLEALKAEHEAREAASEAGLSEQARRLGQAEEVARMKQRIRELAAIRQSKAEAGGNAVLDSLKPAGDPDGHAFTQMVGRARRPGLDLADLQRRHAEWSSKRFGPDPMKHKVYGLTTALALAGHVGRICHHHLKQEQSIRGGPEHHDKGGRAAVGTLMESAREYAATRHEMNAPAPYHSPGLLMVLGVVEESGELAKAALQREWSLREGNLLAAEGHAHEIRDAVGDIFLYLCDVCTKNGWDLASIVGRVADQVFARVPSELPPTEA